MGKIQVYKPADIVYLDETGIDDNEVFEHTWSPKGKRAPAKKSGFKKVRLSILGALNGDRFFAPFLFEGSCNRQIIESYFEDFLVPELRPGQVIVMDNASFHKNGRIQEIIENAGCFLIYLPPYSPELNPIEKCWSWVKNGIRKLIELFKGNLLQAASEFFRNL